MLEGAVGGGQEIVFSAPPQHGKTELTCHALVWLMLRHPKRRFAYGTYSQTRAREVSHHIQRIAQRAGLELRGTQDHSYTAAGGSIKFVGRGAGITGSPVDGLGVIDDILKGHTEANSKAIREASDAWHTKDWMTRHHPGTSSVVMATRWHEDDLSGRLIGRGWRYLNLPAIAEENDPLGREPGEPLSPMWSRADLEKIRARGAHAWAALYQGRPRPDGGQLFEGVSLYQDVPAGIRRSAGLDLAYSKRTQADWSVFVSMGVKLGATADDHVYYVIDVVRKQVRAPEFALALKASLVSLPGIIPRWYCAGAEHGVADLLGEKIGRRIKALPATADKLSRAQGYAAAWNSGRVLIPADAPWADLFVAEHREFSGLDDAHDDQVDAAVAAFDELAQAAKNSVTPSKTIILPSRNSALDGDDRGW